jgi:hypothetical protein
MLVWTATASAATTGRGGLFFGSKSLDHGDWGELDSQSAFGVNLDVKDTAWPVWISAGYLSSREEETVITSASPLQTRDIEGKTAEYRLGVKKDFNPFKILRISGAGGPAYITASIDNAQAPFNRDSDGAVGYWLGAEAIFYLGFVSVGVGYNYSDADVKLLGSSVNAGGSNLAFAVGFGW